MTSFSANDCRRLTAGLVVITFLVIALGGLIRIYDAGESCPDWPTCFGTWGFDVSEACLLYTSPSPRDVEESRMPSSA